MPAGPELSRTRIFGLLFHAHDEAIRVGPSVVGLEHQRLALSLEAVLVVSLLPYFCRRTDLLIGYVSREARRGHPGAYLPCLRVVG